MFNVKIKRTTLVDRLTTNRDAHRALFEKALLGYQKECIRVLEANIDKVRRGSRERIYIGEIAPEDHTKDYNTVLNMLEMSTDDVIELSRHDFENFVLDNWDWKPQWTMSNSKYT
jgi:NOL1/NOP2/fmu family ribosome biogenesis protein